MQCRVYISEHIVSGEEGHTGEEERGETILELQKLYTKIKEKTYSQTNKQREREREREVEDTYRA